MMNDLLTAMSADMGIDRYNGEPEDCYIYRICYSALGQWCLRTAQSISDGTVGTTKQNQTMVVNELILRYSELFPGIRDRFINEHDSRWDFPVFIRRVLEETGYLLTDRDNRNQVADYRRCIPIGDTALYFGVPNTSRYMVNGLGTFTDSTNNKISAKEFLIRDDLTSESYFQSQFDAIDFCDRDINPDEMEYFNPLSNNVPSESWSSRMETDCSVARNGKLGPYFRVMRDENGSIQFADEPIEAQDDSFDSYEYRRLYFALKAHYHNPLKATISRRDSDYSKIRVRGHLPNREYYFLLLLSWPENNAFDKVNFIIRNYFVPEVVSVLINIGIEVNGGNKYE